MAPKTKAFSATLEKGPRALGWTIVHVPFDPTETWKNMVRLRVAGEINGFPFRTSLFPESGGTGFFLLVNREMQRGAGALPGDTADFRLWPDLEPRPAELPDELAPLLDEEPGLREFYESFSEYTRREIGKWVMQPNSDESRLRRAEQMAERLLATMESERELPPAIAAAFRARRRARTGWDRMTETQRRHELLAVFYYQTPDARQRRIDKLCDAAEKHAGTAEKHAKYSGQQKRVSRNRT
jgi:uncharacterized protein YdeI (YjbR/CyaY-like superfamily)